MYQKGNRKQNSVQRRRSNFAQSFKAAEPELFQMISFVRRNGEVKRHVSLAIINMMKQKGIVPADGKVYVKFLLNRYSVKVDGLASEHPYTDEFFVKALLASGPSIGSYIQLMVNDYLYEYDKITINDSKYNTEEGKAELTDIAAFVINHITDKTIITEDDDDKEHK